MQPVKSPNGSIKIGDRVYLQENTKNIGTVKSYYYDEFPICVEWDNGTFDWYNISNLIVLPVLPELLPPKPTRHPCE